MPDDVDAGDVEVQERAENATGTDVLTAEQYSVGYITDEGVVAGIFWWNDPCYPANGDAAEFVNAQNERILESGQLGLPGRDDVDQQGELEPAR